jgi:hypothetical protein
MNSETADAPDVLRPTLVRRRHALRHRRGPSPADRRSTASPASSSRSRGGSSTYGLRQAVRERHVPNSDRSPTTTLVTLGAGFLGNVMVRAAVGAPLRGQCFVVVEVVRGRLGAVQPLACLVQGYVSSTQRRGWPGWRSSRARTAAARIRSVLGTDPAAGVEVSETVPTGARWRSLGSACRSSRAPRSPTACRRSSSTTGPTCCSRRPPRRTSSRRPMPCSPRPRSARRHSFDPAGINIALPPDLVLNAGSRIRTVTRLIDAGDNYGAPRLFVEEWIAG